MDIYNRTWITERAIPIVQSYDNDITLRALHYRLVSLHGFPNTIPHYKRVIGAMTAARWDGLLRFDNFVDHDRKKIGDTKYQETTVEEQIEEGKDSIEFWMNHYSKNRWENQDSYVEVWIEKKALISAFKAVCFSNSVALCPCKGYPSLTFLNDAYERYQDAAREGKKLVMLYFGDYDPSGEDIPRNINDSLSKMGVEVEVRRIALMEEQVLEMGLPPAPTKTGDSRSGSWEGIGQVELDAIEPRELGRMAQKAIDEIFDRDLHRELKDLEDFQRNTYVAELKEYVKSL